MLKKLVFAWFIPAFLHLFAGLSILWFYYSDYAIRVEALPVHFVLVTCFFCIVFGVGFLVTRLGFNLRLISLTCALLPILLSVWYLIIHISTATAFFFWADPTNVTAFLVYIPFLPEMLRQAGLSPFLVFSLAAIFLLLLAAAYVMWFRQLKLLYAEFGARSYRKLVSISALVLVGFSLAFVSYYGWAIRSDYLLSLRGEPVADFFRTTPINDLRFKTTDPDPEWYRSHGKAAEAFREGIPYDFNPANVILIVLDAARADRMPMYGYERNTTPFLDSLYTAGKLSKVEYAASTCSQSECGITTMLASAFYTRTHRVNYKLHEALYDLGYHTSFLMSGDHSRLYGFMRQFYGEKVDHFRDGFSQSELSPADDAMLPLFIDELPDAPELGPSFFYIHMMSPHIAGTKHPDMVTFTPAEPAMQYDLMVRGVRRQLDENDLTIISNNYDNGLFQADYFIREIFQRLTEKGFMEDAVVVITSDHGDGLGEAGIFGHAKDIHHTTINIPFLVYTSGEVSGSVEASRPMRLGSLVDVPPVIFGRLGLPAPVSWEGKDLFVEQREISHHLSTHIRGNRTVIRDFDGELFMLSMDYDADSFSLYHFNNDPIYPVENPNEKFSSEKQRLIEDWKKEFER